MYTQKNSVIKKIHLLCARGSIFKITYVMDWRGYDFGGISHVKVNFIVLPEIIDLLTYQINSPNSKHICIPQRFGDTYVSRFGFPISLLYPKHATLICKKPLIQQNTRSFLFIVSKILAKKLGIFVIMLFYKIMDVDLFVQHLFSCVSPVSCHQIISIL